MRSRPTEGGFESGSIDADNGIIPDVVMVQEGPAKGHGVHLEAEFIENIVKYDVKHYAKRGLKARFGHPSASGETMGTQLGLFKNFRLREVNGKLQEIADLHLLSASEESPTHPGMRSWVLKMAAEQPDFIMSSIVFSVKGYYQRNPNGNKHNLIINEDYYGPPFTNLKDEFGEIFVEFQDHYYTDLVEAGAATDALFSNDANPHLFVSQFLSFIAENPELKTFAQAQPDKVFEILKALGIEPKTPKKFTMNLKEIFFGKEAPTEELTITPQELTALRSKMQEAETAMSALTEKFSAITKEVEALKTTVQEKETALTAANKRITELEAEPADEHTTGAAGDEGSSVKTFQKDPITAKAMASYEARQKRKAA